MNKKFIKNKHADVPVTILVIGVFAICVLAIISFYFSDKEIEKSFMDIGLMEQINSQMEKYIFYEKMGIPENEIQDIFGIKIDEAGNKYLFLEKLDGNKKVLFSVKYNLPS
ncbi:hypothetical protein KAR52_02775 [Candidatus Pacearchaeota archaeon]|nr:hypothetical protein [Candidatus Pacearchaeota archaeon]